MRLLLGLSFIRQISSSLSAAGRRPATPTGRCDQARLTRLDTLYRYLSETEHAHPAQTVTERHRVTQNDIDHQR
ncbi:hypothetical protein KGM_201487 [Danaus plexippus plexippus]|uniref:Uncharacterized protein n=1 Tax=Danaus plexippus plexippus TaxID=278856 RepID=A0A212FIC1_DANPL|nr:hypothetical protein KGM_201487 [Danaus plexippus plexippus]